MKPNLELNVKCFNLKYTLECGQCFRWKQDGTGYIGVIANRVVRLEQYGNKLKVWSNEEEDLEKVIREYLDLNKDYLKIEQEIAKIDNNIYESLKYSSGIHILNQSLFETIISYIISANNNIKRISKSVEDISKLYGDKVIFNGEDYYLFPTIEQLSKVTMDDLLKCGTGFRARYILHDIESFSKDYKVLTNLPQMKTEDARKLLMQYMGIGPKVADCILLFSLKRSEVFPIDTWVKRIMEKLYFKQNTRINEIQKYAVENFGEYSGIVQQHLFHNVREGNI